MKRDKTKKDEPAHIFSFERSYLTENSDPKTPPIQTGGVFFYK
ncbi:hypothetical protein CHCC20441_0687 [Bacillus licheniformis]|uniref:Uncharacterized protein n=1 Tax=Bacillus licheniformis TaxID=1402 RepID=A0A8B5Y6C7_BACLI|nr:hypothetical protein B4092_2497 [Bacillus licheniformis]KYC75843.1 hypothetical protein B4090_2529 [Bacillus licheniformis]KYC85525.1 hypothetical protein B4091_2532 [Bacillus licheniformis]KYD01659.1 hypothetical protein B4164_2343 [Bacillus licheniformis]OLF86907.1 hypothetical protein B4094_4325 [Bacillus licheniformis]